MNRGEPAGMVKSSAGLQVFCRCCTACTLGRDCSSASAAPAWGSAACIVWSERMVCKTCRAGGGCGASYGGSRTEPCYCVLACRLLGNCWTQAGHSWSRFSKSSKAWQKRRWAMEAAAKPRCDLILELWGPAVRLSAATQAQAGQDKNLSC